MKALRSLPLLLPSVAILASALHAQTVFLGIRTPSPNFVREIHQLVVGTGTTTAITFGSGMVPLENAIPFEIDQRTGDLIIAARPAGGGNIGIFRTVLTGTTATSQTLLVSVPSSSALEPVDLHRERTGGYLLVSRSGPAGGDFTLHRIGFNANGALVTAAISITNPALVGTQRISDVDSGPSGDIFLTGTHSGTATTASVFTLPAGGGTLSTAFSSTQVNFRSIGVGPAGQVVAGGTAYSITTPFNLVCNGGPQFVGPGPNILGIDELYVDDGGTAWMMLNGAPPTLQTHNTTTCGLGAVIAHGLPAGTSMVRVNVVEPTLNANFGYSCTTAGTTFMPTNLVTTPPTIGGNWVTTLINGVPNGLCTFSMGLSEISTGGTPLPIDLTGIGATDCALWQSNDASSNTTANGAGTATFTFAVPNDPTLVGTRLYGQWVVFTTGNPAGFVVTNAVVSTI